MPSSRHRALGLAVVAIALGVDVPRAAAQQQAQGFAVERFYPPAPGGGWFVMDALDIHGGLGGAMALTLGYATNPLRLSQGGQSLAVVSDQAFANFAFAITYDRFRVYLDVEMPVAVFGQTGTVSGFTFTQPGVDGVNPASNPDTVSDVRIGFDERILGAPGGRFRLGAGAQLYLPNRGREDYITDGTIRAMVRVLVAGDIERFTYAAHVGTHIRPLDDSPAPGSPHGSELLFGVAGGARLPVGQGGHYAFIIGPEIYGATAYRDFFGGGGTALEALLGARLEGTDNEGMQVRVKLGAGAGLNPRFGAPEWRLLLGIEVFNHRDAPAR